MDVQIDQSVSCPYCGELLEIIIDIADLGQELTEDCHVCCRPIVLLAQQWPDGEVSITARSEDDTG